MILPDVNILLYAVNRSSDQHSATFHALRQGFDERRGVAFAGRTSGFSGLSTRRGIFPQPLQVDDALHVIEYWLGHLCSQVVHPGERHAEILRRLLRSPALTAI
jgi:uncharacterized protein